MPSPSPDQDLSLRLAEMEEGAFQRMCNDLLAAELGPRGVYRGIDLRSGHTDGGADGTFKGDIDAKQGEWIISVKHQVKDNGEDAIKDLTKKVKRDQKPSREELILLVTNVRMTRDQQRGLTDLVDGVFEGSEIERLLRKFPFVARNYDLLAGEGDLVFRPAGCLLRDDPLPFTLRVWEEALERCRDALRKGHRLVLLHGPVGSGRDEILRELALRWLRGGLDLGRRIPVYVEPSLTPEIARALGRELHPDTASYLFFVPPLTVRRLSDIVDTLESVSGDHAVVLACSRWEAEDLRRRYEAELVDLRPPALGDAQEWLFSIEGSRSARAVELAGTSRLRPVFQANLLQGRQERLVARLQDTLRRTEHLADEARVKDALLAVALQDSFNLQSPLFESLASWARLEVRTLERLIKECGSLGLLKLRGVAVESLPEIEGAILVQACRSGDNAERLVSEIRGFFDGKEEAKQADANLRGDVEAGYVRVLRRLAEWTDQPEVVLPWMAGALEEIEAANCEDISRILSDMAGLAQLSDEAMERLVSAIQVVLERVESGKPPSVPAPLFGLDVPADYWPGRVRAALLRAIYSLGSREHQLHRALVLMLRTCTVTKMSRAEWHGQDQDVLLIIESLVHPLQQASARRLTAVLRAFTERLDSPQHSWWAARLGAQAAGLWLATAVPYKGRASRGTFTWNESDPGVIEARQVAVEFLARLLRDERLELRICALEKLKLIGARPSTPVWSLSNDLARRVNELLEVVVARAPSLTNWGETALVEEAIAWLGHSEWDAPNLDRQMLAKVLRALPDDPGYEAWRAMVRHDLNFPMNRRRFVEALEAGRPKEQLHQASCPADDDVMELAPRLHRAMPSPEDALAFLRKVIANWDGNGFLMAAPLRAWVAASPETFRPLVLGPLWKKVPDALRGSLFWAAVPTFKEEISLALEEGRGLGLVLDLRAGLSKGERADPEWVWTCLGPLVGQILPPHQRASLLYELAGHADKAVRQLVWTQKQALEREGFRFEPADLLAIVRRLIEGETGEEMAWELACEDRSEDQAISTLLADRVLQLLSEGKETGAYRVAALARRVRELIRSDPSRWVAVVRGFIEKVREVRPNPSLFSLSHMGYYVLEGDGLTDLPSALAALRLLVELLEDPTLSSNAVGAVRSIALGLCRALDPEEALPEAERLLDEGRLLEARFLLAGVRPLAVDRFVEALRRLFANLREHDPNEADRVVRDLCRHTFMRLGPSLVAEDHATSVARVTALLPFGEMLERCADEGGPGASDLRTIARAIREEDKRLRHVLDAIPDD